MIEFKEPEKIGFHVAFTEDKEQFILLYKDKGRLIKYGLFKKDEVRSFPLVTIIIKWCKNGNINIIQHLGRNGLIVNAYIPKKYLEKGLKAKVFYPAITIK